MKRRGVDVVVVTMLVMLLGSSAHAQVPAAINYQGVLVDENGELTGTYDLEFNLYDAVAGGTLIWGPQMIKSVLFVQGRYNVVLGSTDTGGRSIADAFDERDRYLGIKVDGGAEISPRQRILSAPYAIRAGSVESVERAGRANSVRFSTNSDPIPGQSIYWDQKTGDIVMRNDGADEEDKGFRFDNYTSTMVRISERGLEAPACRICLRYDNFGDHWPASDGQTCVPLIANSKTLALTINEAFRSPRVDKEWLWMTFECKIYRGNGIWEWPKLSEIKQRESD